MINSPGTDRSPAEFFLSLSYSFFLGYRWKMHFSFSIYKSARQGSWNCNGCIITFRAHKEPNAASGSFQVNYTCADCFWLTQQTEIWALASISSTAFDSLWLYCTAHATTYGMRPHPTPYHNILIYARVIPKNYCDTAHAKNVYAP